MTEIKEKFVNIVEKERLKEKDYLYDKLYRFFAVDLTVFPLVIAILSTTIEIPIDLDFNSIVLILIAIFTFVIAVIYKFIIIAFKLGSFNTPLNALDNLQEEDWEEELIQHRWNKLKEMEEKYFINNKMIRNINQSISFTMSSIILLIILFLYINLVKFMPSISITLFQILILIDICILFVAIFYKVIKKEEIKLLFKKYPPLLKKRSRFLKLSKVLSFISVLVSYIIIIIQNPTLYSYLIGFLPFFFSILIILYEITEKKAEVKKTDNHQINKLFKKFHQLNNFIFIKGSSFNYQQILLILDYIQLEDYLFRHYFGIYLDKVHIKAEKTGNLIEHYKISILNNKHSILFQTHHTIYRTINFNDEVININTKSEVGILDECFKLLGKIYEDLRIYVKNNFRVELKIPLEIKDE